MKSNRNFFLNNGVLLAAVPAYLYCASAAKYGGFLGPLRLDPEVLERNFQQILYNGFLASFGPALFVLTFYAIYRLSYSHTFLPVINDELRKSWKRKRQFLKLKHWLYGKRKDSELEQREKKKSICAALFAAIFFLLILTFVYFECKGKQRAISILQKINEKQIDDHTLMTVTISGKPLKLLYLTCGTKNCAGIDPRTRVVHYFPQIGHSYNLPIENVSHQTVDAKASE